MTSGIDQIAEVVGRTPAACRQLTSRVRRSIRDRDDVGSPRTPADPQVQRLVETFVAACAGGDLEAVARTLATEISGWATVDGKRVR